MRKIFVRLLFIYIEVKFGYKKERCSGLRENGVMYEIIALTRKFLTGLMDLFKILSIRQIFLVHLTKLFGVGIVDKDLQNIYEFI